MKETVHMIKTHPIKTLAFFGGCGAIIGTGYCTKLRMDTNEAIRKTHDDTNDAIRKEAMMNMEKLKYQRDCDDIEVRKEAMMNMEKIKYQQENNDEEFRKLTTMNRLKNEEISIYRQRIPRIIRWLM